MVAALGEQVARGQPDPVPPDSWARRQEIAQLGEITPNVAADFDPLLGTPTFIRSTTALLTRRSGRTSSQVVADFVNDNPATFGVSLGGGHLIATGEFTNATYRTLRDFITPSLGPTGVRHLTYQQTHSGQDIYGCILTANVTGDGMLVNIGSRFVTEPASPLSPPACDEANRTVRDVVAAACDEVQDSRIADIVNLIAAEDVCAFDWKEGRAFQGVGDTALWVRSVLHPMSATELVQAWVVRLPSNPGQEDAAWECMVKHSDLTVLSTHDLTMHFCQPEPVTYRVYTDDSPVPGTPGLATTPASGQDTECTMRALLPQVDDCGNPINDTREWVTITAADVLPWSPFGWLNEGTTWVDQTTNPPTVRAGFEHCFPFNGGMTSQTCGNNAIVYRSDDFPSPYVGVGRLFADADPASDAAAAAHVFETVNAWHDKMHALGFDEAAGNLQQVNASGGGVGGDPLLVAFRAGVSGYGNLGTLDGETEDGRRMLLRLGMGSGGVSAAVDFTVIYHELTHALSSRLHVGVLTAGGSQTNGMWEGWGDYFAVALTTRPTDDIDASYPVFAWSARPGGAQKHHYYYGAREYPYTRNMSPSFAPGGPATNSMTYLHANPGPPGGSAPKALPNSLQFPGNPNVSDGRNKYMVGVIWASSLLQARATLADAVGATVANELLMQLVVDGMKLNSGAPSFVTARDAILQADLVRNGGVNQSALWPGFAERGLGALATPPTNARGEGTTESFDQPAWAVSVFYPDDVPFAIATCEPTIIKAMVVAPFGRLTEVRATASPDPCSIRLPSIMIAAGPGEYAMVFGPAPCKQSWEVWVEADVEHGTPPQTTQFADMARWRVIGGTLDIMPALWDDMEGVPDACGTAGGWVTSMEAPYPPGSTSAAGAWSRVDPTGGAVQPAFDSTPGAGLACWVTENRTDLAPAPLDDVDSGGQGVVLDSPKFSVPPGTTAAVELSLWYVSRDGAAQDVECIVEWLIDDEVVGEPLATFLPAASQVRWRRLRFAVDTGATDGCDTQLRVRFVDPPPDSTVEGGLDDVRVAAIVACAECCDGDMNMDGNLDQADVAYLAAVVAGGPNTSCVDPDFNHDGNVDQDDVAALITYVGGGGCP